MIDSMPPSPETRPATTAPDGLPQPQRAWALIAVLTALAMSVLDGSMTNVALPSIARDLGTTPAHAIWAVNGYQLAVIISLLPLAALGEIVGYAKLYRVGLVVFIVASLVCALATSFPMLVGARIGQGFGAAGVMSVNAALIRHIYPRASLGRGLGYNAMTVAISSATGPTVAAAILAAGSWHWLYAINVPIALLALLMSRSLPRVPGLDRRFDWQSALLNALVIGLFILGIEGLAHGGTVAATALPMAAALIIGVFFVRLQLRRAAPILPVDLLKIPLFALSIATAVLSFMAQIQAYVALPFYIQSALGRSPVETGIMLTPWPVATAIMAPIAGRLADRLPAGLLGGVGLAIMSVGLVSLTLLPGDPSALDVMWRTGLCGIGFGFFQTPNNRAIMLSAPVERTGSAGGMMGTARLFGQTTGAAIVALAFTWFPAQGALVPLLFGATCAALGALVSLLRLAVRAP